MKSTDCQALEGRVLFAVTAEQSGRNIIITGTGGDDHIEVERFGKTQGRINDVNGNNTDLLIFDLRDVRTFTFDAGDGDDEISLGRVPGKLIANGGTGDDSISASRAGEYTDSLLGNDGNDYLFGGPGRDTLGGGNGYDNMLGAEGNDYMFALSDANGDDTLNGAEGKDTADFSEYQRGVRLQIGDTSPANVLVDDVLRNGIDTVIGTGFSDIVYEGSGRNRLIDLGRGYDRFVGGGQNETVIGGRGNDTIFTNAGDDTIIDEIGDNSLSGGTGIDVINGTTDANAS